jgi:antitoxin HicB
MKVNKGSQVKDIKFYMGLDYPITIDKFVEYDGKKKYVAEITDLPGCSTHAETIKEALEKLEDAKIGWLEVSLERGLDIPEPITEGQFSGKFLLRIPSKLHRQLALRAEKEGQSLNQFIKYTLERYIDQDLFVSRLEKYFENKFNELKIIISEHKSVVFTTGILSVGLISPTVEGRVLDNPSLIAQLNS